jgi:hypothetical protein
MFVNETEMKLKNNGTKIVHSIDMNETDTLNLFAHYKKCTLVKSR